MGTTVKATATITTSDSVDVSPAYDGVLCQGAGDVKLGLAGGGTVIVAATAKVKVEGYRISRVYATGTTATTIQGLYDEIRPTPP